MKASVRYFPGNFLNNLQQALADNPSNQKKEVLKKTRFSDSIEFSQKKKKREEKKSGQLFLDHQSIPKGWSDA